MWQPKRFTSVQMEERRLEAARLLRRGKLTQTEIARQLGVSRWAVNRWAGRLRQAGGARSVLQSRPKTGRPPRLSHEQWRHILEMLGRGAKAFGFETERWTLWRIAYLIQQQCGVSYHAHYIAEKLKNSGWSVQQPAVSARERDEELAREWLRGDWPRIKKRLAAGRRRSSSLTKRASPSCSVPAPHGRRRAIRPCCGG